MQRSPEEVREFYKGFKEGIVVAQNGGEEARIDQKRPEETIRERPEKTRECQICEPNILCLEWHTCKCTLRSRLTTCMLFCALIACIQSCMC